MKVPQTIVLILILAFSLTSVDLVANADSQPSTSENCPTFDPISIFDEGGYISDLRWRYPRKITWNLPISLYGAPGSGLNSENTSRRFSLKEIEIIQDAIDEWDRALDGIQFQKTEINGDLEIGLVENPQYGWIYTWESALKGSSIRYYVRSRISINSLDQGIINEGYFSALVSRRIANILGFGFISSKISNSSVVKGTLQDLYDVSRGTSLKNEGARHRLSDYDIGLMRSLYGESTCKSTFGVIFDTAREKEKEERAKLQEARRSFEEAKAKAEAEAKAKAEAEAKAKAEAAKKKSTIACVKGKVTKKVTAVKPKCPMGYRKN